MTKPKQAK